MDYGEEGAFHEAVEVGVEVLPDSRVFQPLEEASQNQVHQAPAAEVVPGYPVVRNSYSAEHNGDGGKTRNGGTSGEAEERAPAGSPLWGTPVDLG